MVVKGGMETPPDGGLDAGNRTAGEDGSCSGRAGIEPLPADERTKRRPSVLNCWSLSRPGRLTRREIDGDEIWGMKQSATCSAWLIGQRLPGAWFAGPFCHLHHILEDRVPGRKSSDFWWFPLLLSATRYARYPRNAGQVENRKCSETQALAATIEGIFMDRCNV